jgi:sec-independent protein translocase protein TatA
MLDIGVQELLVVMVLALLVFGPDKLPDLGRRLGRALREFRRASDEFRSTIETNLNLNEESILPPSATAPAPATPADDGLAAAPTAGLETPVTNLPAAEPRDVPRGLTPDLSGPFEETDTSMLAPREPFCTQRGGRLLHRTGCAWATRIPETERIAMKTAAEGWELGLRPCPVCDPQEAVATSEST